MLFKQFQNTINIQRNHEQIIFTLRYIGIFANISLDDGVRENGCSDDRRINAIVSAAHQYYLRKMPMMQNAKLPE